MHRRALLASLGVGTLPLAGCIAGPGTPGNETGTTAGDGAGTELPDACPTTQGIDVEWPEELDETTVVSFVEAYEHAYYRDEVVEYEPDSRLDSYELGGSVRGTPRAVGDGWILEYSGSGGVYRPTLALGATVADPPEGADVVQVSELDEEEALAEMLREAAETGEAEHHVDPPGEPVERHLDRFESLSDDFDGLSGRGNSDELYVDVEGETVELTVAATDFHGDYWWSAWYYVDERVVRRTDDGDADPRDGELLECRELE